MPFTAADIRYTRSKDGSTLCAILLAWPTDGLATLTALGTKASTFTKITSLSLLGFDGPLSWTQDASGLHVRLPKTAPGRHAFTLKTAL